MWSCSLDRIEFIFQESQNLEPRNLLTSAFLVTIVTKQIFRDNQKIYVPFERAWKTDQEKYHNIYPKTNILGDITQNKQNDVTKSDVIEHKNFAKIQKILFHSTENLSRNKKYYQEKIQISQHQGFVFRFAWTKLRTKSHFLHFGFGFPQAAPS